MSNTLLMSRADFDMVTFYLSQYSKKFINFAQTNGYNVVDLYDDNPSNPARLSAFEPQIRKKPAMFIGCSHGNESIFTGQDLELLLKTGVNEDELEGVQTYLWACLTAQKLGPAAVAKKCPVFYGYNAEFTFVYHPNYTLTPLDDPYARAFFDAGLATGYAMILGKTPKEVYEATIERYNYWFNYWQTQNDPLTDDILTWLNWDRSAFMAITADGIYEAEDELQPTTTALNIPIIVPALGIASALFIILAAKH